MLSKLCTFRLVRTSYISADRREKSCGNLFSKKKCVRRRLCSFMLERLSHFALFYLKCYKKDLTVGKQKFKTLESSCNNANGKKQDVKHFRFSPIRVNRMAVTLLISYNLDVMIQFAVNNSSCIAHHLTMGSIKFLIYLTFLTSSISRGDSLCIMQ